MTQRLVALLRGINVGGTRKLPMAELRTACADAGLGEVATHIQSGNLVLDGADPAAAEAALEALITKRFGLDVPVVARKAGDWAKLAAHCPFPAAAKETPNFVLLLVAKRPPAKDAVAALAARARYDEAVARCGPEIAIHFPAGSGKSKLTPALIDRLVGSPTTTRNWATVLKLADMAAA